MNAEELKRRLTELALASASRDSVKAVRIASELVEALRPSPRTVFVLWNGSTIHSIYATEAAARAAEHGNFFDVTPVVFYEH